MDNQVLLKKEGIREPKWNPFVLPLLALEDFTLLSRYFIVSGGNFQIYKVLKDVFLLLLDG